MRGQPTNPPDPLIVVVAHTNAAIRTPLMTMLGEQAGWSVYGATNGAETLRIALIVLPQLVLLDPYLRGMDGFATIVALQAHGIKCPVVALVAGSSDTTQGLWKSQGFNGVITLADRPSDLLARLEALLVQG